MFSMRQDQNIFGNENQKRALKIGQKKCMSYMGLAKAEVLWSRNGLYEESLVDCETGAFLTIFLLLLSSNAR